MINVEMLTSVIKKYNTIADYLSDTIFEIKELKSLDVDEITNEIIINYININDEFVSGTLNNEQIVEILNLMFNEEDIENDLDEFDVFDDTSPDYRNKKYREFDDDFDDDFDETFEY